MQAITWLKTWVRSTGKSVAYSEQVRAASRRVLATEPGTTAVRRFVESRKLEGPLRRIASESLPAGTYFAKLTIQDWESHRGQRFRLKEGDRVVYGNEIEPPPRGRPLEYRNFVVTSSDLAQFNLDINARFTLQIGRGAFSTPQQVAYDEQYGVEVYGDVAYSLRGNTVNPSKLLVTFPGFGPSTTRISYAVSYLKELTDSDLSDTLMICFQDRYLAAGSYMMVDSAQRPLYERVNAVITDLARKHGIGGRDMLLFGASKGGSIAILYAQAFPDAQLLLVVPQMNLPYYFSKPFFKDNLYRAEGIRDQAQPQEILRGYFAEGRRIDYFYTNNDELSNCSLIEAVEDVANLTKYRVGGVHGAVARTALPAIIGVIRRFLGQGSTGTFHCEGVRCYRDRGTVRLQLRLGVDAPQPPRAATFVEGRLGRTRFLQMVSDHKYQFVKVMNTDQLFFPAYDRLDDLDGVRVIAATGDEWRASLPPVTLRGEDVARVRLVTKPLRLQTENVDEYSIVNDDVYARFSYRSAQTGTEGETLEIRVVDDARDAGVLALPADDSSHVVTVSSLDGGTFLDLFALRLAVAARAKRIRIKVDCELPQKSIDRLRTLDWDDVDVQHNVDSIDAGSARAQTQSR